MTSLIQEQYEAAWAHKRSLENWSGGKPTLPFSDTGLCVDDSYPAVVGVMVKTADPNRVRVMVFRRCDGASLIDRVVEVERYVTTCLQSALSEALHNGGTR